MKNISNSFSYLGAYFICSCQQIVCHLFQVWGLPCIYEAHHFLKDIWVYVTDVHSVLGGKTRDFCRTHLNLATEKHA